MCDETRPDLRSYAYGLRLYLPALWAHTTRPTHTIHRTSGVSVVTRGVLSTSFAAPPPPTGRGAAILQYTP